MVAVSIGVGLLPLIVNKWWLSCLILLPTLFYAVSWLMFPMAEPSDGPTRIVLVMKSHPYLAQAQYQACDALIGCARKSKENVDAILEEEGLNFVIVAGLNFEHDPQLVARVLMLISKLSTHSEIVEMLLKDGILPLTCCWLNRHLLSEIVCKHALVLLTTLFSFEDENLAEIARKKALEECDMLALVIRIMETHVSISRTQHWGAMVLFHLTVHDSTAPRTFIAAGGLAQVCKSLTNHASYESLHNVALAVIRSCLTPSNPHFEDIVKQLVESQSPVFELVERSRLKFPQSRELQVSSKQIMNDCKASYKYDIKDQEADQ